MTTVEPARLVWTRGLAGAWGIFIVPLLVLSCTLISRAATAACASIPRWIAWTALGWIGTVTIAIAGLIGRHAWGAGWSAVASVLAFVSAAPDMTYVPAWATFELVTLAALGAWSVMSYTRCRSVEVESYLRAPELVDVPVPIMG